MEVDIFVLLVPNSCRIGSRHLSKANEGLRHTLVPFFHVYGPRAFSLRDYGRNLSLGGVFDVLRSLK